MEHTMDKPATLTLNQERLAERGRQLAMKHAIHDDMVAKEKARRAVAKSELDAFEAEMSQLASTIRAGYETVAQGDLFADQALATEALANVAEKACTCNPETPSVHDPGCAVHGVDSEPVQPGKLHKFRVSAGDPEACGVCGFDEASGIHGRHGFVAQEVTSDGSATECSEPGCGDSTCAFCPLPEGDEIHQAEQEVEATDTADTATTYGEGGEGDDEPDLEDVEAAESQADVSEAAYVEPEGVIDAIKQAQDDRPLVFKRRRKAEAGA